MFSVQITFTGLDTDRVMAELDDHLKQALERGADAVVARAQLEHVFQNRTGTLEGSIAHGPATGSMASGSLSVEVNASAYYAEYVVAATGDDFLQRALDTDMGYIEGLVEEAFVEALNALG